MLGSSPVTPWIAEMSVGAVTVTVSVQVPCVPPSFSAFTGTEYVPGASVSATETVALAGVDDPSFSGVVVPIVMAPSGEGAGVMVPSVSESTVPSPSAAVI